MKNHRKEEPSTVVQLASALAALGLYGGENTEAEHAAEAKRVGSAQQYRLLLVNALLGAAETEALLIAKGHPMNTCDPLTARREFRQVSRMIPENCWNFCVGRRSGLEGHYGKSSRMRA